MNPAIRLEVSIDDQTLKLIEGDQCLRSFPISTAAKGMGFIEGTFRTPTGRFRIVEKIGGGEALGTIFKKRAPAGHWSPAQYQEGDLVLTRILRLEGLDPENANTLERHIYIHGTNRKDRIGQPASQGCIRLGNQQMIELFEKVDEGAELVIHPATRQRGKLMFIDCDSTLSTIEGIDELARARGELVFSKVVALTNAAMNGEIPITDIFPRRMEMIRPDRALCAQIARLYVETIVPGAFDLIAHAKQSGWTPVILSGGFSDLIKPLAARLGIDHVEAVPLMFDDCGGYLDFGRDYPTTRNLGKNEVIRDWKAAMLPERVVMIGDGVSDLETRPDVDLFIGYGGVVSRRAVQEGADRWVLGLSEIPQHLGALSDKFIDEPPPGGSPIEL